MKRLINSLIVYILVCSTAYSNHLLQVYITDAGSGEPLIGAGVVNIQSLKGVATDTEGRVNLNLITGAYQFAVSYLGYKSDTVSLLISTDTTISIVLHENINELAEVEVTADFHRKSRGVVGISKDFFEKTPALFGEREVVRALQMLPGVQSGSEGSTDIFVRGGSSDQNLISIDGVPLFNLSHLFGMFSVFNSDVIEKADLHKNYIPSQMSGRLASAIDVSSKQPDYNNTHGGFQIGMISTKLFAETPIVKNKLSTRIAARGSYAGIFIKPISKTQYKVGDEEGYISYYFYDINADLFYKINKKNTLHWNLFFTDDRFITYSEERRTKRDQMNERLFSYVDIDENRISWKNLLSSVSHHVKLKNNLFLQQQLFFTSYLLVKDKIREDNLIQAYKETLIDRIDYARKTSSVNEYSYQIHIDWIKNKHTLKAGSTLSERDFKPDILKQKQYLNKELVETIPADERKIAAQDFSVYADYFLRLDKIDLTGGLRGNLYFTKEYRHISLLPRISLEFKLPKSTVLQFAGNINEQNLHMVMGTVGELVNEFWLPATKYTPVQRAKQASLSVRQDIHSWFWSMDIFFRYSENQIEYNSTSYSFRLTDWRARTLSHGVNRAYGAEWYLTKQFEKVYLSAAYNLSKSERKFERLNRGRWYPYINDRRHDFSLLINYEINPKLNVSVSWIYGTGKPYQISDLLYPSLELVNYYDNKTSDSPQLGNIENQFRYFESRNGKRMKPFHHLDVSVNYSWKKRKWDQKINFSIFNVYNRKNIFDFIIKESGEGEARKTKYQTITLLPFMPSVSYEISF